LAKTAMQLKIEFARRKLVLPAALTGLY
jgi:hypothetical protein